MLVPVYEPPPSQTEDAVYDMRLKNVLSAGVTILIRVNVVTHNFRLTPDFPVAYGVPFAVNANSVYGAPNPTRRKWMTIYDDKLPQMVASIYGNPHTGMYPYTDFLKR